MPLLYIPKIPEKWGKFDCITQNIRYKNKYKKATFPCRISLEWRTLVTTLDLTLCLLSFLTAKEIEKKVQNNENAGWTKE
jgi:hypothetical protein